MKEFKKVAVFDLMDEAPYEIYNKFLDNMDFKNGSYTHIIVQENDNVLATWLLEEGYPKGETVLVKISW